MPARGYSRSNDTFGRRGERGQEVGDCASVTADEAHVKEVLPGFSSRPEEDLTTLVKDDDLVKIIISSLWGLVNSQERSVALNFRSHAQALDELNRSCGIETTRGVVPALERRSSKDNLGN